MRRVASAVPVCFSHIVVYCVCLVSQLILVLRLQMCSPKRKGPKNPAGGMAKCRAEGASI